MLEASGVKSGPWLGDLASGRVATLAWLEGAGPWDVESVRIEAKPAGAGVSSHMAYVYPQSGHAGASAGGGIVGAKAVGCELADQAAEYRLSLDRYREELGRTGDFSMIVSLNDAITVDQFRRAEDVGVTDLLTMPWAYYGGFRLPLQEKLDGMKRFSNDIIARYK